jgi:hypothetical protein
MRQSTTTERTGHWYCEHSEHFFLQLLYRPQVIPHIRDRLHSNALLHNLHLLRAQLSNPNPDRKLLPLRIERDRRASRQRRRRRREPPARGRQAGTHHVRARKEEADRAAVDAHMREDEWIYNEGGCWFMCAILTTM